ncbi:MAG: dihydropteroate synthase [Spirochaetota bacterium]
MGIVNCTPDSFYAGSRHRSTAAAVDTALRMAGQGADILDVGGESTRPGAEPVPSAQELDRVIPVIEAVRRRSGVPVSVDTRKAAVAAAALDAGAVMVNDVSGLQSETSGELAGAVARAGAYIVLMHMRGEPADMQRHAVYTDVTRQVSGELDGAVQRALEAGIQADRIILDPGIGFAKLAGHNLALLHGFPLLRAKGFPLLVGLSRKSFLSAYAGVDPADRLLATVAANAVAIFQGADIVRVHDVGEAVQTARLVDDIKNAG